MFAGFGKTERKCLQLTNKCNKNDICKKRILGFQMDLSGFMSRLILPGSFILYIYLLIFLFTMFDK